jgi:hypothetical protein
METHRILVAICIVLVGSLCLGGCSSRPCREPRLPELDQTSSGVSSTSPSASSSGSSSGNSSKADETGPLRVRVYKPDGSRQCEKRTGRSVEATERELAGIPVYHREKRSDGLMHIQVCGSPTGMINIFEIDSSNLKKAEERGFKKWEEGR